MNALNIFIAAPLFNEMERRRNSEMKNFLISHGFTVFLAQDDVGLSYDMIESDESKSTIRKNIFQSDMDGVSKCDIVIALLDGRTPDEGACVELGMGKAFGKKCILFSTDDRAMDKYGDNNIMVDGCADFLNPIGDLEILLKTLQEMTKDITKQ